MQVELQETSAQQFQEVLTRGFGGVWLAMLWLAWMAGFAVLTARIFEWHLLYFKSPGPEFYRLALVLVPAAALAALAHSIPRLRRIWRWEWRVVAILVAAACLRYEPRASVATVAVFLAFSATGEATRSALEMKLDHPLDRVIFHFGAGASFTILVLVVLGLLGQLRLWELALLVVAPLLALWKGAVSTLADLLAIWRSWRAADIQSEWAHPLAGPAVFFGTLAAACSLMIVLAPSIAFDSVANHLPLVQFYASQHALHSVSTFGYSYYPQGMELLWTLAYVLAGQPAAQMLSGLFFLLFLAGVVRLARACGLSPSAALIAAVSCATLPFLHWTGSVMKNDMTLAFFELLSLLSFIQWLEGRDSRWVAASGFFLGQAFGVKYVALFAAPAFALLWGFALVKDRARGKMCVALALAFLLSCLIWPARAYVLTGNPTAPDHAEIAVGGSLEIHQAAPVSRLISYAKLPWDVITGAQIQFESPLPHPAGLLLPAFAPLILLCGIRPGTRVQKACAIFAAVYLVYWMSVLTKVRYAILPFALLAILAAAMMVRFYDRQSGALGKAVRGSLLGLETYCFTAALMGLMIVGVNGPQIRYFAGKIDKFGYLHAAMQAYGAVQYLWSTHDSNARVFGVMNVARAYAPNPMGFDGVACPLGPCDPADVVKRAKANASDFLILPADGRQYREVLARLGNPPRVYQDDYFSVFRVLH